ncbi:hypothetical protein LFM09_07620 [Lentzea alba]|uniref:hypothetical protein n=1 Tax=Lentzea alba TaxID=2714351 RepID=UPI0039BFFABE
MEDFVAPITFVDVDAPMAVPEIGAAVSSGRLLWHMFCPVQDGLVHEIHLHLQHILADATGMEVWRTHLDRAIQDPDWGSGVRTKRGDEQSGVNNVDSSATLRRDERLARSSQAVMPVIRTGEAHSHYRVSTLLPDLVTELQRVGDAAGVSVAVAAKFMVAWAMAQLSGRPDVLLANVVHPGSFKSEEINCKISNLRELVTVSEEDTFAAALTGLRAESFNTYLAWEDRDYAQEIDRHALMLHRRGIGGTAPVYFNYITAGQGTEYRAVQATEREQSVEEVDISAVDCLSPVFIFLQLNDQDIRLEILADEHVLDRDLAAELPGVLAAVALRAQQASLPVSSVKNLFPGKYRHRCDAELVAGRWVSLPEVRKILAEAPGVVHAEVEIADEEVRAELVLADSGHVFDVHEFVTCHLFSHRGVCAPDTYIWRKAGSPVRHEWAATREALPKLVCETENEKVLVACIEEFHRERVSNLAETYLQAGGRLVLAPAVVEKLKAHGLTGLGKEHFEAPYSLRSVARRLTS